TSLSASAGQSAVVARANEAAADNKINGVIHTFASADVQVGSWNTSTHIFIPNGTPSNAVKLKGKEVVPLMFGKLINKPSVTVRSTAIACAASRLPGFTGLSGFSMLNNTFIGSYNSASVTNPTHADHSGKASAGSNGLVTGGNNSVLSGDLILGPDGEHAGLDLVDGGNVITGPVLAPPAQAPWNPRANPGGISQAYSVGAPEGAGGGAGADVTLPGGTYWFTSLSVGSNLSFSGPATLYINGNVDLRGSIKAYQSVPANVKIFQIGADRTFGSTTTDGASLWAVVSAPTSALSSKNNFTFHGSGVFNSIDVKNNADFYLDEAIGSLAPASIALVQ
ncbi:MAG: hypothetical protein QOE14_447, partial [Humisphaera sp.]|nr:hypothetical protein [Humisphaera sp.]